LALPRKPRLPHQPAWRCRPGGKSMPVWPAAFCPCACPTRRKGPHPPTRGSRLDIARRAVGGVAARGGGRCHKTVTLLPRPAWQVQAG